MSINQWDKRVDELASKHNPTIIGEPREPNIADIDRRLGGLPNVLAYAHQWTVYGTDPRTEEQKDIPLLLIVQMARQSGLMETYAIGQLTVHLTEIVNGLRS